MIEKLKEMDFHFLNNSLLDDDSIERFVQKIVKIFLGTICGRKHRDYYGTIEIRLQDDLKDLNVYPIFYEEFVHGDEPADCFKSDDSVDKMTVRFVLYSVIGRQGTDLPFSQMGQIEFLVKYFNGEGIDIKASQVAYERIWEKIGPFLVEDDCFLDVRWENVLSNLSNAALPEDIL